MPTQTIVPRKVKKGLDDILDAAAEATAAYKVIRSNITRQRNPDDRVLIALLELSESLHKISEKARDARQGNYEPHPRPKRDDGWPG